MDPEVELKQKSSELAQIQLQMLEKMSEVEKLKMAISQQSAEAQSDEDPVEVETLSSPIGSPKSKQSRLSNDAKNSNKCGKNSGQNSTKSDEEQATSDEHGVSSYCNCVTCTEASMRQFHHTRLQQLLDIYNQKLAEKTQEHQEVTARLQERQKQREFTAQLQKICDSVVQLQEDLEYISQLFGYQGGIVQNQQNQSDAVKSQEVTVQNQQRQGESVQLQGPYREIMAQLQEHRESILQIKEQQVNAALQYCNYMTSLYANLSPQQKATYLEAQQIFFQVSSGAYKNAQQVPNSDDGQDLLDFVTSEIQQVRRSRIGNNSADSPSFSEQSTDLISPRSSPEFFV